MAVSKRLRYEILRRDNHQCRYCGGAAPDVALTVDHVIPVALGGSDQPDNLVTACQDCNAGKSASSPDAPFVADVARDALRWARAMETAQQMSLDQTDERERRRELFADVVSAHLGRSTLPSGWTQTCDQFVAAGAIVDDWEEAGEVTARYERQDDWRYFCGVVWTLIRRRQDVAMSLLSAEDSD